MAIQIRRGTDAEWESNNSNIVAGEPAVTLDTGRFFVGTGNGEFVELQKKGNGGDGLTDDVKQALLQIASKVAYIDEHGQDYYDALESALYPDATLVSISAVYTQSGTVYNTDSLDSLRTDLVVTALYSDATTATVTAYTLSGTLEAGNSEITVTYGGKTDTFEVYAYGFVFTKCKVNGVVNTDRLRLKSNTARTSGNAENGTTAQLQLEAGGDSGVYLMPIRAGATTITVTRPSGFAYSIAFCHYDNTNGWIRDLGTEWRKTSDTADLSSYNSGSYYLAINVAHYTNPDDLSVDGSYDFTSFDVSQLSASIS